MYGTVPRRIIREIVVWRIELSTFREISSEGDIRDDQSDQSGHCDCSQQRLWCSGLLRLVVVTYSVSQALYNKLIDASYFVTIHWVNWRFIVSVNTKNLESWIINCRNITVVNIVLLFTSFNSNYLCFRRMESNNNNNLRLYAVSLNLLFVVKYLLFPR